jgi:hypothetical protein
MFNGATSLEDQLNSAALAQLTFSHEMNSMREEDLDSLEAENQGLLAKAQIVQKLVEESIRKGTSNTHRAIRISSIIQKYNENTKIIAETKRRARNRRMEDEQRESLLSGATQRQVGLFDFQTITFLFDLLHSSSFFFILLHSSSFSFSLFLFFCSHYISSSLSLYLPLTFDTLGFDCY